MMKYKQLIEEAFSILERAEIRGIVLRLFGSVAVRVRCIRYSYLLDRMQRFPRDIDFVGLSSQREEIEKLFKEMGYTIDLQTKIISEGQRYLFKDIEKGNAIDVVIDKLDFCHKIHMTNRLELDKLTIPVSDMLLEKLQIVQINPKDLIDLTIILLEHDLGNDSAKYIDAEYISNVLADDWGFYFTVLTNLSKIEEFIDGNSFLAPKEVEIVKQRIGLLRHIVKKHPKSIRWKLRSIIGDNIKWYDTVDEMITQ